MSELGLKRITVAVDGSKHADRALSFGIDLAKKYGGALTVVAVAPLVPLYVSSTEPWVPSEVPESEITHYRQVVDAAVERAQKEGVASVSGLCLDGVFVVEIIALLEHHPTDLLIMGSRGLSTAKRLLLGSVSDAVAHHVKCPVLLVREPVA